MRAGDTVVDEQRPELGKGKVLSLQPKMGTALVQFENSSTHTYHTLISLVPKKDTAHGKKS